MNKRLGVIVAVIAAALLIAAGLSVARQASIATARDLAQARVALLGRWSLVAAGQDRRTVTLDFHGGEAGSYLCTYPGGGGRGTVSFSVRQESLRRRILDILQQHRPVPATYTFRAPRVPIRSALGGFGTNWHGMLLGDGNTLVLYSPPLPPLALRRLGAG